MTVTTTRDGLPELLKAVKLLTQSEVLVGVPAENVDRRPSPEDDPHITNALIGYINEFGDPERNIPARPHLIPAVNRTSDRITSEMIKGGEAALRGELDEVDKTLHKVGMIVAREAQSIISSNIPPPLSPRTLAERRRRGRTGETALIDTGQYRRSITYVVRRDRGRS